MNAITQLRPGSLGLPDAALLWAAVQAFPGCLAVVDCGVVLYANPAWEQMFECDERGAICGAGEFAHRRRDGSQVQLRVASTGFRVRGRDFQVLSAFDGGPCRQDETELREGLRLEAMGRLAGGVAHDFNNLLTGILLYCDLLMAELEKDSRGHHHAREIRRAGEHGAKVVQQLLAVARPQAPEPGLLVLNDVVRDIEELLTRLIGENIVLTTSLAGELSPVRMDPAQVQQILLNLVLNARDAMPEGGEITIATRNCAEALPELARRWVELSVSDTGCGMDAATLGRAFEPFFTTKAPGRGTGLGLATAYRLAKLEGGTIVVESQPGEGTRVSLQLPRADLETAVDGGDSEADALIAEDLQVKGSTPKVSTPRVWSPRGSNSKVER